MQIESTEIQEITDLLNCLFSEESKLKAELKEVQKKIDEAKFIADKVLEDNKTDVITCGYWSFGYQIKTRNAFNQTKFKADFPELYDKYKMPSETKTFMFGHKENK